MTSYDNNDIIALNISCLEKGVSKLWEIKQAHKNKINTIFMNDKYILTGGDDFLLKIWHVEN